MQQNYRAQTERRIPVKRTSVYLCIIATLLLLTAVIPAIGFTQGSKAQSAASPQQPAYRITAVTVKPGMGLEFENVLKSDVLPAMKKAGIKQSGVWKTVQFGEAGNYLMTAPMQNLADLDNPSPLVKVLGQNGMAALTAKLQRFVAGAHMYMITGRNDLSIAPKPGYVVKMGVLVTTSVAPGRTEEFEKNFKEVVGVIGKTNAKGVLTARVGLGGNPNEYTTLVLFDSFADLDKFVPAFMKAAAGAKLASQAGIVMHQEYATISNIPELSIQPPAQKAAK
jgi:heme-degrading monooxygenase HmoA